MSETMTTDADIQKEEMVSPKHEDFIDSHLNVDGIQRLCEMMGGRDGKAN
jgi:hypothetical protein